MIIVLNGYPGVGKLTIGRELATATAAVASTQHHHGRFTTVT